MLLISTCVAAACAGIVIFLLTCQKVKQLVEYYGRLGRIPGPKPDFLLGNLSLFYQPDKPLSHTIGPQLMNLSETYRSQGLFLFYIGWKPIVCVFNPSAFQTILNSAVFVEKSTEYETVGHWLGDGLATAGTDRWRKHRKILRPAFHVPVINNFVPVFNEHALLMCQQIAERRHFHDFNEFIINVTLDVICETVLGVGGNARSEDGIHPYAAALQRFTEILVQKMFCPWLWPESVFYFTKLGEEMRRCRSTMRKFVRQVVRQRKEALMRSGWEGLYEPPSPTSVRKTRHALLDQLLKFHMEGHLTEEQVMEEVNTFTFAGHDTVGISMAFTLFCLGHHPDVQEKVKAELDLVIGRSGNCEVTGEHVKDLKYLEAVIKEALRLFPPGPTFGRKVTEDVDINGHTVPAGTDVWFNVKAIHMDPNIFPEPQTFDPERFMDDSTIPPFAFAAFSQGPRNCIGSRFALIEEKILLSHLLQKFTVKSLVPTKDLLLTFEIILRCRTPLKMEFTPRHHYPSAACEKGASSSRSKELSPLALHMMASGS